MTATSANLIAIPEAQTDYDATARLGTAAFGDPNVVLSPAHLKWFYEKAFSRGSTVVALTHEGQKVGQIVMIKQGLMINGKQEEAAQLVDLYIDRNFRARSSLASLYGEVEKQFRHHKIRVAFGMPNAKAVRVNEHFFQLNGYLSLGVRIGVSYFIPALAAKRSFMFSPSRKDEIVSLGDEFATAEEENGLQWDGIKLYNRLDTESRQYGLHATENLMLISSTLEKRGVKCTFLCGFLKKTGTTVTARDVRSVTKSACAFWKRPVFIYAGHYDSLPILPGVPLSRRIHRSPMLLQARDFAPERGEFKLTRFQLMDFDFV